jgi:hypothetical protein
LDYKTIPGVSAGNLNFVRVLYEVLGQELD